MLVIIAVCFIFVSASKDDAKRPVHPRESKNDSPGGKLHAQEARNDTQEEEVCIFLFILFFFL